MPNHLISKDFSTILARLCWVTLLGLGAVSCGGEKGSSGPVAEPLLTNLAGNGGSSASGDFVNTNNENAGRVVMADGPHGAIMRVDMKGLEQGWHGIHFHNVGDCSDYAEGFKASMGHVDPAEKDHGLLNTTGYEPGDMPNIYAGSDGRVTAEIFIPDIRTLPSEAAAADDSVTAILMDEDGFAIVVHEAADDHTTQPIGGAGARVACAAFKG